MNILKITIISKSSRFKCEKCECDYSTKVQKLLRFTKKEVVSSMLAASVSSKHLLEVKCSRTN